MRNGVVFEPLPPRAGFSSNQSYGLDDVLPELRKKPEQWARIREFDKVGQASYIASRVNDGKSHIFKTDFAASVRRMSNGKHALYMRYVGEGEG